MVRRQPVSVRSPAVGDRTLRIAASPRSEAAAEDLRFQSASGGEFGTSEEAKHRSALCPAGSTAAGDCAAKPQSHRTVAGRVNVAQASLRWQALTSAPANFFLIGHPLSPPHPRSRPALVVLPSAPSPSYLTCNPSALPKSVHRYLGMLN